MICGTCRTFPGVPLCGCCRALTRIQVIVTEGHLRASQEGEVLRLLRDTVGGLQDLVEANRTGGGSPDKVKRARRAEEGGAERTAGSPRDTGGKEKKKHPEVEEKEAATRAEEAGPEGEEGKATPRTRRLIHQ